MGKEFKITAKDIYKEAWECRNFEIDHLWQRSVFLAAFLLAIAGGYGSVVMNMLFPNTETTVDYRHHFLAYGLCWLGIVFSILWILMAKGSKHSFEQYEAAITWFFHNSSQSYTDSDNPDFALDAMPYYGNLPEVEDSKVSECIFSPLSGHYSVSKVNATIGIVSLLVWMALNMFHFAKAITLMELPLSNVMIFFASIIQMVVFGTVTLVALTSLCKSGDNDE